MQIREGTGLHDDLLMIFKKTKTSLVISHVPLARQRQFGNA